MVETIKARVGAGDGKVEKEKVRRGRYGGGISYVCLLLQSHRGDIISNKYTSNVLNGGKKCIDKLISEQK